MSNKHNRPDPSRALGYAVYREWKDTPGSMDVVEYFDTVEKCEKYIRKQRKDVRFTWRIGVYE